MTTSKLSRRQYNQLLRLKDGPLSIEHEAHGSWDVFRHGTHPLVEIVSDANDTRVLKYRGYVVALTLMGQVEVEAYEPPPAKLTPAGSYLVRGILDRPGYVRPGYINSSTNGDTRATRTKLLEEGIIEVVDNEFVVTPAGMQAFLLTETGIYWKNEEDLVAAIAQVTEMLDDICEDTDERLTVGSLEYVTRKAEFARSTGYTQVADLLDKDVLKLTGEKALRDELIDREQAYIERIECNQLGAVSGVNFLMKIRITYSYGEADAAWYVDYTRINVDSYPRKTAYQANVDALTLSDVLRDAIRVCDVLNAKFPRNST